MSASLPWRHDGSATLERSRRINRTISLPGARAVVGGLLVATSASLLFAAYRNASVEPTTRWLIIEHDVAAGSTIEASDLALATMDLHPRVAARALDDPATVVGRVAVETLVAGDLVLAADIASDAGLDRPPRRVSLELQRAAALNGDLTVGDAVEVVGTTADGSDAEVVTTAVVAAVSDEMNGGLGSSDRVVVTLTVPDIAAAQLVVAAQDGQGITLVGAGADPREEGA